MAKCRVIWKDTMPHFNLRHFLQTLGKQRGREVFVLQIGAMDGQTFDPVHEYITRYEWGGLLVEPIAEQFAKLQQTYARQPQLKLVNIAIAEQNGPVTMHRIPTECVESEQVPKWGLGVSSFYTDRNALSFDEVKPHITQIEVQGTTLPSLLQEHKVQQIDVLQIDTEGHDYQILKQLDFERYHPLVINMEIVNLPKAEQTACKRLLDAQGYLHIKAGYDLLAVSPKLLTIKELE